MKEPTFDDLMDAVEKSFSLIDTMNKNSTVTPKIVEIPTVCIKDVIENLTSAIEIADKLLNTEKNEELRFTIEVIKSALSHAKTATVKMCYSASKAL